MELYGSYTSPFVRHCRIALLQTELECQFIETDAAQSALLSPTKKVPILIDCDLKLTDSTSILTHIYEVAGEEFLTDVEEVELYNMTNTLLDSSVNLLMLAKFDNITPEQSVYLTRQKQRIETGLEAINNKIISQSLPLSNAEMRVAIFIDWALFRDLFSLTDYPYIQKLLDLANTDPIFNATAPQD
ncbi:glutathione S-transferase [Psychromonas sp. RZ22]|uniref:glutathione S-transferase family protein n=1 Tax=Psychromonas algarum TaxID=2555643 RepID=UPI00106724C8|nr:glutathione S-transferase [Psychromonas sp. RZ22]TEW56021.1 glutathione S-transferase [Psychromonas sp. RZ22]